MNKQMLISLKVPFLLFLSTLFICSSLHSQTNIDTNSTEPPLSPEVICVLDHNVPENDNLFNICYEYLEEPDPLDTTNILSQQVTSLWIRTDTEYDYPDPPFPVSTTTPPWWEVFWELGDGRFVKERLEGRQDVSFIEDESNTADFRQPEIPEFPSNELPGSRFDPGYLINGDYTAFLRAVPIKSAGDESPRGRRISRTYTISGQALNLSALSPSNSPISNFPTGSSVPKLKLEFHVDGSIREGDTLTAVIAYRRKDTEGGTRNADLEFTIPPNTEILGIRHYSLNTTDLIPRTDFNENPTGGRISWTANMENDEEHAVFIEMLPPAAIPPNEPPVIHPMDIPDLTVGQELQWKFDAEDPNADNFIIRVERINPTEGGTSDGLLIDITNPRYGNARIVGSHCGKYFANIIVEEIARDGSETLSDTLEFEINVSDPNNPLCQEEPDVITGEPTTSRVTGEPESPTIPGEVETNVTTDGPVNGETEDSSEDSPRSVGDTADGNSTTFTPTPAFVFQVSMSWPPTALEATTYGAGAARGSSGFRNILGGGKDVEIPTASPISASLDDNTLGFLSARDPNNVEVWPKQLYKGEQKSRIRVRVNFTNEGNGPAKVVKVVPYVDGRLDSNTLISRGLGPTFFRYQRNNDSFVSRQFCYAEHGKDIRFGNINCTTPGTNGEPISCIPQFYLDHLDDFPQYRELPDVFAWTISNKCSGLSGVLNPVTSEENVFGTSDGYIEYSVVTDSTHKFKIGEKIPLYADVYMDRDSLRTDFDFHLPIVRRPFRIPKGFGIRGGIDQFTTDNSIWKVFNDPFFKNIEGWNAGITWKWRLPNLIPADWQRFANYNGLFPTSYQSLYFQAEALFHQKKLINNVSPILIPNSIDYYASSFLEFPLQLRFVPDLAGFRFLSFSGGYSPTLLLSAKPEGLETRLPFNGLGDRFQQAYFFDLAIGNIVWPYGLSLGLRYQDYFNSNGPLNMEGYKFFQLYLHLNLR